MATRGIKFMNINRIINNTFSFKSSQPLKPLVDKETIVENPPQKPENEGKNRLNIVV